MVDPSINPIHFNYIKILTDKKSWLTSYEFIRNKLQLNFFSTLSFKYSGGGGGKEKDNWKGHKNDTVPLWL